MTVYNSHLRENTADFPSGKFVSSDLINIEDVAEMFGVSVATIHLWRKKGTCPVKFAYFGRRLKARKSQVDKYINDLFEATG